MTMYVLILAFVIARGRSLGVRGHVDRAGNWGVGATFTFGRKRRSAEQKFFTLSLEVDKCNFNLYDVDRDDVITKEELVAVFGDDTKTTALFEALAMLSGDGIVNREEFLYVMPRTVEGC
ncbi:hypothetical protein DPMN_043278 [Dreissena polymorpha]|uniref:EF-hand domain-containing protein n=1 Tax=Dreissena polymorpha TaxID=45954 RepID=A0A9D4HVG0_DREPO|nr:hypothetical protein DPMN_043278 [Dreissena polymorpha]